MHFTSWLNLAHPCLSVYEINTHYELTCLLVECFKHLFWACHNFLSLVAPVPTCLKCVAGTQFYNQIYCLYHLKFKYMKHVQTITFYHCLTMSQLFWIQGYALARVIHQKTSFCCQTEIRKNHTTPNPWTFALTPRA